MRTQGNRHDSAEKRIGIWSTFRQAPLAAKTVLGGVFISRLAGFLNIFLVLYLLSKGYSDSKAVVGLGAYGVGGVVGSLAGGSLSTRLGSRATTVISLAGASLVLVSVLYLPSYGLILGAVALAGLAAQVFRPASSALLSLLTPGDRQVMVFGIYRFGLNLGAAAAPLLGYGLYHLGGRSYTLLFWGEALAAVVYATLAWITLPSRAAERAVHEQAAAGEITRAEKPVDTKPADAGYRAVLRDRRYSLYLLAILIHSMVYVQYLSTLPLDIHNSRVSVFWYTLAVALNGLVVIALELPMTRLTQSWPARIPIAVAMLALGIGVACYGLPLGPAVILGGTLIWSLGEIIGGPAMFAHPAIAAPAALKSRYLAGFQFTFGLGTAIGPMLGGLLFTTLGHRVWPILAACSAVAATCAFRSVTPAGQPSGAPRRLSRWPRSRQPSGQETVPRA
jgi:MFS family permease